MERLVALLRGINLGPRRRIAMADLRALLEELGYTDVRTVLASGNAIISGPRAGARRTLEAGIAERFGLDVDVILRTMDELHEVVDADPFGAEAADATRYFVVFLDAEPDAGALQRIMEQDFSPDRLAANGRELYAWCPDGMRDSRLMKELGKPGLARTATVRNWSTVNKLLE